MFLGASVWSLFFAHRSQQPPPPPFEAMCDTTERISLVAVATWQQQWGVRVPEEQGGGRGGMQHGAEPEKNRSRAICFP